MNNIIKITACIVLLFTTIFCNVFQVYALDFDPYQIYLYTDNAPENTAYIDILVPLNKNSDSYVDFTNQPLWYNGENKPLFIDKDSQIAKYNDNGYYSLSLHTEYIRTIKLYDGTIYLTDSIQNIYKKYKDFKAVYVDKNGNILKITDTFSVKYDVRKPYAFIVNDNSLTLRIFGSNPFTEIVVSIILSGTVLLLLILSVFIVRKRKNSDKKRNKVKYES